MKYCFCIYLFILAIFNSCCGKPRYAIYDDDLMNFIQQQGDYIQLSDYNSLPEQIKPYYINIQYFLFFQGQTVDSYFVSVNDNYIYGDSVRIYLNHVNGFKESKQLIAETYQLNKIEQRKGTESTFHLVQKGMLNEKDGELILDKNTGEYRNSIKYK